MKPTGGQSTSGAWIFVSHSNRDIEKVRKVRNLLERRGDNPVLFFLKCMEDSADDDRLLWDLIEREIKARSFFLLCDSPNARISAAVQREVELVNAMALDGKVIETIDLEKIDLTPDEPTQPDIATLDTNDQASDQTEIAKVVRLAKRATVFLVYSLSDQVLAARIKGALRNNDYGVSPDDDPPASYIDSFLRAVERGFVVLLLTEASLRSEWARAGTNFALERAAASVRSNVVPVIIGQFDRSALPRGLQSIEFLDLTTVPFDQGMGMLMSHLKSCEMA